MNEVEIIIKVVNLAKAGLNEAKQGAKEVEEEGGGALKKFGAVAMAVGAVAGIALVKFAQSASKAASDAQQSLGGTQAVFGKYADQIVAKSNEAAQQVGISSNAYRENANIIGSLFKNQGVATDQLAGKTEKIIQLGADLAATYGGSASKAIEAVGDAYKGITRPLEAYGISLHAALVTQEEYRIAGVSTAAGFHKLTEAQQIATKQQAITNLIMKQGKDAQGQFAIQTNTLAEKSQILKAQWTDLSATIGAKLIPAESKLLSIGSQVLAFFERNPAALHAAEAAVAALTVAFIALAVAMAANPVGLVIIGLAALAAGLTYAWQKSQLFRAVVITVFKSVADVVLGSIHAILAAFAGFFGVLGHLPGKAGAAFRAAANAAHTAANAVGALKNQIDAIPNNKTINIGVHTSFYQTGKAPGSYGNGLGVLVSGGSGHKLGSGGYMGQGAASGGIRSGLTMVGENGAELIDFGSGRVYNHGETNRMVRNSGTGGSSVVHLVIDTAGSQLDKLLQQILKKSIRVQGGNVQAVLGS